MDIPEDEVESVQNSRGEFILAFNRRYFEASTVGTVANISVTELYHWTPAVWKMAEVENGLKQNPELNGEFPERIWESVADKINDIAGSGCKRIQKTIGLP